MFAVINHQFELSEYINQTKKQTLNSCDILCLKADCLYSYCSIVQCGWLKLVKELHSRTYIQVTGRFMKVVINKNIKMSSFKSSENIQKKEGGPDRSVSDNQSSSVTL